MLTKKTKYALKALVALAIDCGPEPVGIAELAEREGIPERFLELILLEMRNAGILKSKKGKGGGYLLGRSPKEISLGDVLRVVDGPLAQVPCVSLSAYRRCEDCADESTCVVHMVMRDVRNAMADILDNQTLEDVVSRMRESVSAKSRASMYQI